MNINSFFHKNPIFRREDFVAFKNKMGTYNPLSITSAIQHYIKTGRLLRIHQGLFAVIPPGEVAADLNVDPYLLAAKSAHDGVLGYHSALELHGVAHSSFGQFTFITTQKIKPFEYQGIWFKPVSMPIALKKSKKPNIGVETINRQGIDIKITTIERTFVDVLDRIELCGGLEEVARSIAGITVFDIDVVIKYCLMIDNATLIAKVGYFLEQRQGAFAISEQELLPLLNRIPTRAQYIIDRHQEKCQLIPKWNIMVPISLINNTWEEPNYDV
jgi:predicted transcriptional regulator of viral defense system